MLFRLKLVLSFLKGTKPSEILVKLVKGVAEGKFGEKAKKVYWAVEGVKTPISIVLAVLVSALELCVQNGLFTEAAPAIPVLYSIAGFLLAVGLYDGAVRAEPPSKE